MKLKPNKTKPNHETVQTELLQNLQTQTKWFKTFFGSMLVNTTSDHRATRVWFSLSHWMCVSQKHGTLYSSIVVDPLTLSTTRAISLGYAFYPTNVHVNEVCNRVALQGYSTFVGIGASRIAFPVYRCVSISYLLIEDLTKETRGSSPPDHYVSSEFTNLEFFVFGMLIRCTSSSLSSTSCKTNAFSTVFLYEWMGMTSCKWWSGSVRMVGCMCTRHWWFLPICYSTTLVTLVIGAWFVRSQPSAPITIRNICIKRKIEVSWVWYIYQYTFR